MLPGVCRTCVINADRRSIRKFSSTGSPVCKTISSTAQIMKTNWTPNLPGISILYGSQQIKVSGSRHCRQHYTIQVFGGAYVAADI